MTGNELNETLFSFLLYFDGFLNRRKKQSAQKAGLPCFHADARSTKKPPSEA
jgi:hypothetical protein